MNTHKMLFVGIVLYLAGVVLTPWAMPDNLLISADFTWHTKSALICGLLAITAGFVIYLSTTTARGLAKASADAAKTGESIITLVAGFGVIGFGMLATMLVVCAAYALHGTLVTIAGLAGAGAALVVLLPQIGGVLIGIVLGKERMA